MTRTVFSPSQVAHVWAQQSQDSGRAGATDGDSWRGGTSGRCSNGSAYFEGGILFSYGRHFVTGVIVRPQDSRTRAGLVFVTAEKNSKTTNARVWEAWQAVSHYSERYRLPTIGEALRDMFEARANGRKSLRVYESGKGYVDKPLSAIARQYISDNAQDFSPANLDAATALGAVFGLKADAVSRAVSAGLAAKAKEADKAAKAETAKRLKDARDAATVSDETWRERFPSDGADGSWQRKEGERFLKRLNAALREARLAHKAGRFAAPQLDKLKGRVAEYRAHLAATDDRLREAAREGLKATAETWLAMAGPVADSSRYGELYYIGRDALAPSASSLESFASDLAERVATAKVERQTAYYAERFAAWSRGDGERPNPNDYAAGSDERAAILASQEQERAVLGEAYQKWSADKSAPRPSARLFLSGELRERFPQAWDQLTQAERAEANAKAEAERAAKVEAWESAEPGAHLPRVDIYAPSGGARIRRSRDGERLETSQGADVPWQHAVKAFRFIKLCRDNATPFRSNGRTVRVGHFTVDWISASGDFKAGCHNFTWAEIERLAKREGVFSVTPSAEAVESSH